MRLKVDVTYSVEKHEDEESGEFFSATSRPLSLVAYGKSLGEAVERANQGARHLLDAYMDEGRLWEFLNDEGVGYSVESSSENSSSVTEVSAHIGYEIPNLKLVRNTTEAIA